MTRALRLRPAGILFYLIFAFNILSTNSSINFFTSNKIEFNFQTLAAIIGVGVILFTSDAIGFIFASIHTFFWNFGTNIFKLGEGGFSKEWKKLTFDIKSHLLEEYQMRNTLIDTVDTNDKIIDKLQTYTQDVLVSYFWQQAPSPIVAWAMRRHTAFFTGMSTITGIILGITISGIVVIIGGMGFSIFHIFNFLLPFLIYILWMNAKHARLEALQIIDLWFGGILDPKLKSILEKVQQRIILD